MNRNGWSDWPLLPNTKANVTNIVIKTEYEETGIPDDGDAVYEIPTANQHLTNVNNTQTIPMMTGTTGLTKRTSQFHMDISTTEQCYNESKYAVNDPVGRLSPTTTAETSNNFEGIFEPIIKIEKCESLYVPDPIAVDAIDYSTTAAGDVPNDGLAFHWPVVSNNQTTEKSGRTRKRTAECPSCHKLYVPRLLNSHMESVHFNLANLNRTICGLCWKEFGTETLLKSHQKEAHSGGSYGCDICGKTFASKRYLSVHILNRHTQVKTYLCDTCGEGFPVPFSLQDHVKRKHMQHGHDCHSCDMKFVTAAALNDHFIARHTDERRFTCEFNGCGKTFKWRSSFKSHRRVHAKDKYECSVCLKQFSFKGNLRNHLKTIHNQIVENKCLTSKVI